MIPKTPLTVEHLLQALQRITERLQALQQHPDSAQLFDLQQQLAAIEQQIDTWHGAQGTASTEQAQAQEHIFGPLIRMGDADDDEDVPGIFPNGIDGTRGEPLLKISSKAAADLAQTTPDPAQLRKLHDEKQEQAAMKYVVYGVDVDDLAQARWGVIVNASEDAALLKALLPLIQHRSAQQGITLPPLEFRAGETCGAWCQRYASADWTKRPPVFLYQHGETCDQWLGRHGVSQGPVDPQRGLPFYLLIAGHPGSLRPGDTAFVPFGFQYELDMFWGVGRLCFTDAQGRHALADYTSYAEQVIAFEQAQPNYRKQIVYFGTRHEMDTSTQRSADELIMPLTEGHSGQAAIATRHGFGQHVLLGKDARRDALDAMLRGKLATGAPALLFSATHGIGLPADDPRLLMHQGALLCQDWQGFGNIQRDHWFAGEDLPEQAQLAGMIGICFACYGVGWPRKDEFVFRIDSKSNNFKRATIAPRPMIAQLPQRMLARGALAVLGHVDRAWTHSFSSWSVPAQSQSFEDVLARLMAGKRMGFVTDQFNMRQGVLSSILANKLEDAQSGPLTSATRKELGTIWIARNDARNYALLGDPAVRLPVEKMAD
jgi:hypothetical protein